LKIAKISNKLLVLLSSQFLYNNKEPLCFRKFWKFSSKNCSYSIKI